MIEGRINKSLPYIKHEGVRILTETVYESHEAARAGIAAAVEAFYAQNYPDLAGAEAVVQAGRALGDAYCWNNFPHMKVTWNLYPNHAIRYLSDPSREKIYDIELTNASEGTTRVYKTEEPAPAGTEWRTVAAAQAAPNKKAVFRIPDLDHPLLRT